MLEEAPGLQFVSHEKAELLGAPIGGIQATDKIIQGKIDRLRLMGERLGSGSRCSASSPALICNSQSYVCPPLIPLLYLASAHLL